MKKLTINLFACLVIGMGGLTLMQPSESVALSGAAFATMAECEDEHGEMEGDNCGRDSSGNCMCWDNPE